MKPPKHSTNRTVAQGLALWIFATAMGCSSGADTANLATGGVGAGGATNTVTTTGNLLPSGGFQGLGGIGATGGLQPSSGDFGGAVATGSSGGNGGGVQSAGGAQATGGTGAVGGTAFAGSTANETGGRFAIGGAPAQGGINSAGGSATGGTSAGKTLGGDATGGVTNTGGAASGGRSTAGGAAGTTGGTVASGGVSGSGTTPITIWMAGDSTMMNCTNSVCPCGWGSQLSSYFNNKVTVTNRAVGGRSIQTWLYESAVTDTMGSNGECTLSSSTYDARWTTLLSSLKAGDYVMIAFGINDGDTTCPRHVGTARFQSLLDMMVKAILNQGGTPILLTPTDAIVCSGSTVTENRGFLTETKAVATANGVPLIDLNQLSMTLYGSLGFCPNSGDYTSTTSALGKFFCDDHTHFEAAGAKTIAGLVANALRTQGIALAAYGQP